MSSVVRFRLLPALAAVLLWAGCAQALAPTRADTIRFFLESARSDAPTVVLPLSGVQIGIEPKPVISEFDVVDVQVAREELGECLGVQLDGAAARDLYRLTTVHQGRRLVLIVNGAPLGARRIERPWEDGRVQIFVEREDAELPTLAAELRRTAAGLRRSAQP